MIRSLIGCGATVVGCARWVPSILRVERWCISVRELPRWCWLSALVLAATLDAYQRCLTMCRSRYLGRGCCGLAGLDSTPGRRWRAMALLPTHLSLPQRPRALARRRVRRPVALLPPPLSLPRGPGPLPWWRAFPANTFAVGPKPPLVRPPVLS